MSTSSFSHHRSEERFTKTYLPQFETMSQAKEQLGLVPRRQAPHPLAEDWEMSFFFLSLCFWALLPGSPNFWNWASGNSEYTRASLIPSTQTHAPIPWTFTHPASRAGVWKPEATRRNARENHRSIVFGMGSVLLENKARAPSLQERGSRYFWCIDLEIIK